MPTYEFKCTCRTLNIDMSFAELDRVRKEPWTCAHCGNELQRVFTATPAIFRGKGWGKDK